ncbi:hypothetical protein FACS189496_5110 [Bacilli bacterium]|nr:hypothetical protein FACS189496_5110 [Bacilli bacterium]
MALTQVAHDSTLEGLGTAEFPLTLSTAGKNILEYQDAKPVFYAPILWGVAPKGIATCQVSALIPLNPDILSDAPAPYALAIDQAGYMGTITDVTGLVVTISVWYHSTMWDSGESSYSWGIIEGDITDNPTLFADLGNKHLFSSYASNMVDAINYDFANLLGV